MLRRWPFGSTASSTTSARSRRRRSSRRESARIGRGDGTVAHFWAAPEPSLKEQVIYRRPRWRDRGMSPPVPAPQRWKPGGLSPRNRERREETGARSDRNSGATYLPEWTFPRTVRLGGPRSRVQEPPAQDDAVTPWRAFGPNPLLLMTVIFAGKMQGTRATEGRRPPRRSSSESASPGNDPPSAPPRKIKAMNFKRPPQCGQEQNMNASRIGCLPPAAAPPAAEARLSEGLSLSHLSRDRRRGRCIHIKPCNSASTAPRTGR